VVTVQAKDASVIANTTAMTALYVVRFRMIRAARTATTTRINGQTK
jgi:hypothetical protein